MSLFLCATTLLAATTAPAPTTVTKKSKPIEPDTRVASIEFIYWQPDQAGMNYCFVSNTAGAFIGASNKEAVQKGDWTPGFRLGAGYQLGESQCDAFVYWTRFHSSSCSSVNGEMIFARPLLGAPQIGGEALVAAGGRGAGTGAIHSHWHLEIDLIELDLGYRIHFHDRVVLRPYVGVEGGWIHQRQAIKFDDFLLETPSPLIFDAEAVNKSHFHGVGPKIGLNGDCMIGWGFGVLGRCSVTGLCGRAKYPVMVNLEEDPLALFPRVRVKERRNLVLPWLQGLVGIDWRFPVFESGELYVMAGYEVSYGWGTWKQQPSLQQDLIGGNSAYSNLSLQGLTVQAQLSF